MAEPIRETLYDDRCICVSVWDEAGEVKRCVGKREGPDAPFCGQCEARHPDRTIARWVTIFDLTSEEAARCVDDAPDRWGLPGSLVRLNAEDMDALILQGDAAIPPGFTDVTGLVIKGGGREGSQ